MVDSVPVPNRKVKRGRRRRDRPRESWRDKLRPRTKFVEILLLCVFLVGAVVVLNVVLQMENTPKPIPTDFSDSP